MRVEAHALVGVHPDELEAAGARAQHLHLGGVAHGVDHVVAVGQELRGAGARPAPPGPRSARIALPVSIMRSRVSSRPWRAQLVADHVGERVRVEAARFEVARRTSPLPAPLRPETPRIMRPPRLRPSREAVEQLGQARDRRAVDVGIGAERIDQDGREARGARARPRRSSRCRPRRRRARRARPGARARGGRSRGRASRRPRSASRRSARGAARGPRRGSSAATRPSAFEITPCAARARAAPRAFAALARAGRATGSRRRFSASSAAEDRGHARSAPHRGRARAGRRSSSRARVASVPVDAAAPRAPARSIARREALSARAQRRSRRARRRERARAPP